MRPFAWPKFPRTLPPSRPPRPGLSVEALEDRAAPASLVVNTTGDTLNSPPLGTASLRDAILYTNTQAGDNQILVPAGTYTLTRAGADEDAALTGDLDVLATGGTLTIQGAGADKTFIDAAGIDRVFDVHPGARVLVFGATVRGGLAPNGGGFHTRGQLGIHDCVVEGNAATSRGGAVDVNGPDAALASQNSLYRGNSAGPLNSDGFGLGGAISNAGGVIQVNDGVFRDNRTGTLGSGGAVHSRSGLFIAITSTFEQNSSGMGGAVATEGGNANFVESTFTGNKALFTGASAAPAGGAIHGRGEVYVERSTFTQNEAAGGGRGGALANSAYMEVVNSTISGNRAGAAGRSGAGAGVYNSGGMRLVNSTVAFNEVLGGGFAGGVFNAAAAGNLAIQNTIVALNLPVPGNNAPDFHTNNPLTSFGGNLVGINTQSGAVGWTAADLLGSPFGPVDPRLGPLQDNGGPTDTHALLPGSPAIDRGANGGLIADTGLVDQRKLPRVVNDTPDVGAYELQPRTNAPPTGGPDGYAVDEDGLLTVAPADGVLADDADADGDPLSAVLASSPARGQLTLNADGSFTYRPAADFHGTDGFTYRATDGELFSDAVTVTITVRPVNDAPVARDDAYGVDEDGLLTVAPADGVLANDADADGNPLAASLVSGPAHGTLTLNADGSFTYRPAPGFAGADSFTYRVSDGAGGSATATVSVTVRDVVDVKPGDAGNAINLKGDKKIAVAILSHSGFDAVAEVAVDSLRFGRTGAEDSLVRHKKTGEPQYEVRDVNGDGLLDLVVYFEVKKTGLQAGDAAARLTGQLADGFLFEVTELVTVASPSRGKGNGR